MEFSCRRNNFLQGISIVEKIIGRNLTLPILQNVLIIAEDNKIKLTTTDLEIAISTWFPAKVQEQGSITSPIKVLGNFIRTLPEGTISAKEKNNTLTLTQGSYKSIIKGESSKNYPLVPKIEKNNYFAMKADAFAQSLQQVIHATASTDIKPELTGVLLWLEKGEVKIAATDSFRLAEKTLSQKNEIGSHKIIIPQRAAQEIIRIYSGIPADITLYPAGKQIFIENVSKEGDFPPVQIISRVLEGDYPEYTQIIPQKFQTTASVERVSFINHVRAAGLFASKINDLKISFQPSKQVLRISSRDYDIGEYDSQIEGKIEGEEKDIVFNYRYLLDGAQNIPSDEIVIKINEKDKPALMEPKGEKDYLYVLMPIKGE